MLTRVGDMPSSDDELSYLMAEYDETLMAVWPLNNDGTRDASGMIINPQATGERKDGWTVQNVDFSKGEAYDGDASNPYFNYWSANSYTSSMTQAISGLPAGQYSLSAILRGNSKVSVTLAASTGDDSQQTKFTGTGTTVSGNLPMGWKKVTVPAVSVKKGDVLTISLKASGSSWWSADNFQLTLVEPDPTGIDPPTPFGGSNVQCSMFNVQCYDLSGRKMNGQGLMVNGQLPKGVYVVKGKKLMIK